MNQFFFKRYPLIRWLILAASLLFLLPAEGLCSGTVSLNKGAVVLLTEVEDGDTGGPESSLLNFKHSGAVQSDRPHKILRAMAKASRDSQASYWARMGTKISFQKGSDGSISGKARITLYGLSFKGSVIAPQTAPGKALLKLTVSNAANKTRSELIFLTASGSDASPRIFQKDKTSGSLEVPVTAGDIITVELELAVTAGTGAQDLPAEVDFYSGEKRVSFEGLRVEILETDFPLPIATPLPEQVFFYDNARCLNRNAGSCLTLNKGEQVDDLSQRSVPQDQPDTWNDRIACLKIGANVNQVTVYQHPNFKGKSRSYTRTASNPKGVWSLQGCGWDKNVSSIFVE